MSEFSVLLVKARILLKYMGWNAVGVTVADADQFDNFTKSFVILPRGQVITL